MSSKQPTCPCCGSQNIDEQRQECRACHVGLPDGSFDVYTPTTRFRQSHKSDNVRKNTSVSRHWARSMTS